MRDRELSLKLAMATGIMMSDRQTHIRNITQEMGFVPKGLISRYLTENQPEVRIENNISKSDVTSSTFETIRNSSSIIDRTRAFSNKDTRCTIKSQHYGKICSYTQDTKKYILSILETLRDANYTFNDKNEFEADGKPEYRSNVVDLFSYMLKNDQHALTPPTGFAKFTAALRQVNNSLE
ncbi:uncharacterized protein TNCV_2053151 [Trichonephila clavipes]|nr:uncharacterized protein TNCV_2053151 [Trichonephila clavipes]